MAAASTAVLVLMFTVAGALLGAAVRSRMRLRRPRISWLVVLVVGLALRFVADSGAAAFQFELLVASFALLLIFCGRNLTWPGMTVVALGLVLMIAPTLANRGMPVGTNAARAAGTVSLSGARHLQQPGDVLMVLAEILPLRVASRALSFGELIALVGLGDVLFHAVARRPARHTASLRGSRGRQGDVAATIEQRLAGLTIEDTGEFVRVLGSAELPPENATSPGRPERPERRRPAAREDRDGDADVALDGERVPAGVGVSAGVRRERFRPTPAA